MSPKNNYNLDQLTGLTDSELAEVFSKNPRTYMAVKGAVAEKHLEKQLQSFSDSGLIQSFRGSISDFDKDFYVQAHSGREIVLECKNVEVLKANGKELSIKYLSFLVYSGYITLSEINGICKTDETCAQKIKNSMFQDFSSIQEMQNFLKDQYAVISTQIIKCLPQELRESGMPRYEFSKSFLPSDSIQQIDSSEFLSQFDELPLSIDFQRTRNSTDSDGDTRRGRLYQVGEIDIVGACLFSRTLNWEFIYGIARDFTTHDSYPDRYRNNLTIDSIRWTTDFKTALDQFNNH